MREGGLYSPGEDGRLAGASGLGRPSCVFVVRLPRYHLVDRRPLFPPLPPSPPSLFPSPYTFPPRAPPPPPPRKSLPASRRHTALPLPHRGAARPVVSRHRSPRSAKPDQRRRRQRRQQRWQSWRPLERLPSSLRASPLPYRRAPPVPTAAGSAAQPNAARLTPLLAAAVAAAAACREVVGGVVGRCQRRRWGRRSHRRRPTTEREWKQRVVHRGFLLRPLLARGRALITTVARSWCDDATPLAPSGAWRSSPPRGWSPVGDGHADIDRLGTAASSGRPPPSPASCRTKHASASTPRPFRPWAPPHRAGSLSSSSAPTCGPRSSRQRRPLWPGCVARLG